MISKFVRKYRKWKLDSLLEKKEEQPIFCLNKEDRIYLYKDEISYKLFTTYKFETSNRSLWEKLLQPGMTVFDIGANCGIYSLAASRRIGPTGIVYAFEPNISELAKLKANLGLCKNGKRAKVYVQNEALGDFVGETNFFIPVAYKGAYGSIRCPEINEDCHEVSLPINTIDNFVKETKLEAVDLIKMDVEGNELNVLKGGEAVIAKYKPMVLMEVSDRRTKVYNYKARELCDFLLKHEYSLYVCNHTDSNNNPVIQPYTPSNFISYVDVFAAPKEYTPARFSKIGVEIV